MKKILAVVAISTLLAACQQGGGSTGVTKGGVGSVLGGIGGALLGKQVGKGNGQIVGVAVGTLLGAALGRQIGDSLSQGDMAYYNQTSQHALERGAAGQVMPWNNPQTNVSGTVTPSSYYQTAAGQYCREYTQTIMIGGRQQEGYGVACRQSDGTWKIKE